MVRSSQLSNPSATAARIRRSTSRRPRLALVLGSGFGGIAAAVSVEREFSYTALPGFPVGRVPGHEGRLLVGSLEGVEVAVLCGRAHYYEGFELEEVTFPIRVLSALGVKAVLLTNAAGGIARQLRPGDFMLLRDHINFIGGNPLRGLTRSTGGEPTVGSLFTDLTEAYDPELRRLLKRAARAEGIPMREGVYLAVSGPSYETPAEIRAFGRLGASAVGMSTVPETIVARQCGVRVAGISCITNLAAGRGGPGARLDHAEVLARAQEREAVATRLLARFVREWRDREDMSVT